MKYHFTKIDLNGKYTFIMENNLTGYSPEELLTKSAYDMFSVKDIEKIAAARAELAINNSYITTLRMRMKNKKYIWIRAYSVKNINEIISFTKKLNIFEILLYKLSNLW